MEYINDIFTLSIRNKQEKDEFGETGFRECFSIKADLNYEAFMYIAANSGKSISSYHYVNSVKTYDLDNLVEESTIIPDSLPKFTDKAKDLLN